ncbi:unnamed protein product [Echinostoma caproni]|uniref:DUF4178 domain-containing protein n=1 Tax=Echinostoma caproni TaxID=27848 RepID=A0A183B5N5_9TREM|nr:unnamed protein product [Echinostoma caproni]
MEPPPRLYYYEGLFTSIRSIDLPLKILFILTVLILLIMIAAWFVSRKTYTRAPRDAELASGQLTDVNKVEVLDILLRDDEKWQFGVFTGKIRGRTALFVNDWKLVCLYETNANLEYHFTTAPGNFLGYQKHIFYSLTRF